MNHTLTSQSYCSKVSLSPQAKKLRMKLHIVTAMICIIAKIPSNLAFVPIDSHRLPLTKIPYHDQLWTPLGRRAEHSSPLNRMQLDMRRAYTTIEDWTIERSGGLRGTISKSVVPALEDGEIITTSTVVTNPKSIVEGTIVETAGGSRYILGGKKKGILKKNKFFQGIAPVKIPTLDLWSLTADGGVYGTITNYKGDRFVEGEVISTSQLKSTRGLRNGSVVTTDTGSKYRLGRMFLTPKPPSFPVPMRGRGSNASLLNKKEKGNVDEDLSKRNRPARFGSVGRGITKGAGRDGPTPVSPAKKNRPARFGSVGRGTTKGAGRDGPTPVSGTSAVPEPDPVESKPAFNMNLFNNKKETGDVAGTSGQSENKRPARFGSVGRGTTKGAGREGLKPMARGTLAVSVPDPSENKKKRPARFGSVGRGITKGAGRDKSELVPVLNQWTVNRLDQVIGFVSNSPYLGEKDNKKVTTAEVATNMAFVEEGFTVVTVDKRKYLLGEPRGGSKKDYDDEMASYVTPLLRNWDVDDALQITGAVQGAKNLEMPDGLVITTDKVISDPVYIDAGFTIVTKTGKMYKLGRRQKGRKAKAITDSDIPNSTESMTTRLVNFLNGKN